ncbi:MAG: methylglyoxal synthase [Defluviitaleaceae bacterium]|nr:methylglyoxal synthase [Defluviitaleaceae bacterium]MCL2262889.1 methylglyoxal synthase [Defluviitaleaceae bacterium]
MNIALIAHDNKKKLMANLCVAYRHILSNHKIFATGTTGQIVEDATNLHVSKYLAGHLGGAQQLSSQVSLNDIDLVIFLQDPLNPKHYEPDIDSLLRICDSQNIPIASNLATAELLLLALNRGDLDWRLNLKR